MAASEARRLCFHKRREEKNGERYIEEEREREILLDLRDIRQIRRGRHKLELEQTRTNKRRGSDENRWKYV